MVYLVYYVVFGDDPPWLSFRIETTVARAIVGDDIAMIMERVGWKSVNTSTLPV